MRPVFASLASKPPALGQIGLLCVPIEFKKASEFTRAGTASNMPFPEDQYKPPARTIKSFAFKEITKNIFKMPVGLDDDPYLLVLVAEQEFADGREQQAVCLIEAAFLALDQNAEAIGIQFTA